MPGQPTLLLKYLSLDNKGDIHDDLGDIQATLSSEQAAKRHRSKDNRAASVQKAREKRSHEDMTRVLQKNKANMTAVSKQKKTRIPTKQVQCQTCGERPHSDRFTRAGWKSHGTCRACQAKKQGLTALEPDASDSLIVTLDSLRIKSFPYFCFPYQTFPVFPVFVLNVSYFAVLQF